MYIYIYTYNHVRFTNLLVVPLKIHPLHHLKLPFIDHWPSFFFFVLLKMCIKFTKGVDYDYDHDYLLGLGSTATALLYRKHDGNCIYGGSKLVNNFVELAYSTYIPSLLQCSPFKNLQHICYTTIIVIRKNPSSCLLLNFFKVIF